MKRAILILIILILAFPSFLKAEGEIPLTLDEAISIALRDNRDILLKTEDIQKAKAKIAEARSGLLPSLSVSASLSDTRGLYTKDSSQIASQAGVKQTLYKGGKIINTIKYSEYGVTIAQAVLDRVKLEIIFNLKKAFYTFLLAEQFQLLNKQILQNSQAHLDMLEARYKNGQTSQSDVLMIKEALAGVEEAYEASLNQEEAALSLLKNLLYLDEKVDLKPIGEFTYEQREVAYDEGFLKAMNSRPEIRQYEAQSQAAQKAIAIAKADNHPSVYASWDYYSRSHITGLTGATKNWNDYNVLGLTFSWPIFDGWATKAKVEQAIVDLKETQLMKEKTMKDIALELKNAYLELKNALAKIKATQAEIDLYKDTLSVTQEKYKAGIASSLDLEDVSLGYKVSLFNQKLAGYDYILAKAWFDKATGGI
jgi:outer membrane protein TolC